MHAQGNLNRLARAHTRLLKVMRDCAKRTDGQTKRRHLRSHATNQPQANRQGKTTVCVLYVMQSLLAFGHNYHAPAGLSLHFDQAQEGFGVRQILVAPPCQMVYRLATRQRRDIARRGGARRARTRRGSACMRPARDSRYRRWTETQRTKFAETRRNGVGVASCCERSPLRAPVHFRTSIPRGLIALG